MNRRAPKRRARADWLLAYTFRRNAAGLPALAALLSPYYEVYAISAMAPDAIASVSWPEACDTVRDLITAVGAVVDGEAPGCASCLVNMEGE
jgi:hypothetical protein